jgi:FlaA1/EpsC-like NDP-sugar epimerase
MDPIDYESLMRSEIETLLGRDPGSCPASGQCIGFEGKVVLVTGAAGSIGCELCRQLTRLATRRIVLLDQSESGLFDLVCELGSYAACTEICPELGSVRDKLRIEAIFSRYKPDIVFHAAAYKHVPLMETMASEAILTNLLGTQVLADTARKTGVEKFVLVSTDKAVNPVCVMGATKCLAEMYIRSLATDAEQPRFLITRCGNVLDSSGSVIPLFRKQVAAGGPITVTHPDIARYFMTIPEAGRLVIEACMLSDGGEIFVFEMGEPVRIMDIAERMARLGEIFFRRRIDIVVTGLRPGERMQEQLFTESEDPTPTCHPRIRMARMRRLENGPFLQQLETLLESAQQHKETKAVHWLYKMVDLFSDAVSSTI